MTTLAPTSDALATLPITLDANLRDRIVLIDGGSGWPGRAAHAVGLRDDTVVIVADPVLEETSALDGYEDRVVLDLPWLHSPMLDTFSSQLSAREHSHLEVIVECSDRSTLDRRTHAALVVADKMLDLPKMHWSHTDEQRTVGTCDLSPGRRITLSGTRSAAHRNTLRLRALGGSGRAELQLPEESTAQPSELIIEDFDGRTRLSTPWETPSRKAWRVAVELLDGTNTNAPTDLSLFRRQLRNLPGARGAAGTDPDTRAD